MIHRQARREVLITGGAIGTSFGLAACAIFSTQPQGQQNSQSRAPTGKQKEAPLLAQRVRKGDLPPLRNRLPDEPLAVATAAEPGSYGGSWQTALQGSLDTAWLVRTVGYDYLLRWSPNWKKLIPNLAADYQASPDGNVVTLTLRKGVKWSDGHPFTADDVVFAQNDVLGNADIYPVPTWPGKAERLDRYTVRFNFDHPQGLFLIEQATPTGISLILPKHYLRRFHKKYNPTKLKQSKDWAEGFLQKADRWANPDLPSLNPWLATSGLGAGSQMKFVRNPFYWKTDSSGRQLPYLDGVNFDLISDVETMLTKALHGDFDCHIRHFNNLQNKPILARNRQRGHYHFFDSDPSYMNTMIIGLNLNHKNPALRQIFSNKDFRIGLSHAINREEIIRAVYQRQGEPWQAAPRKGDSLYDELLATQYVEYDVKKAVHYLDQSGFTKKDNEGFRLGPDGKRVAFSVETYVAETPGLISPVDALGLIRTYWRSVGIDMSIKTEDRSLYSERTAAGSHDAAVITSDGGANVDVYVSPISYLPYGGWSSVWAPEWTAWYTSEGAGGTRPPAAVRQQLALYDKLKATPDQAKQRSLMRRILKATRDGFYVIGISTYPESYGIVKDNFYNVPRDMPLSYTYPTPAPTNPEQYFKKE